MNAADAYQKNRMMQFAYGLPSGLSMQARLTAVTLFLDAPDGGHITMTVAAMREETALSRSAQFRALRQLIERGVMVRNGWSYRPDGTRTRRRRIDVDAIILAAAKERS